jgi:hypothetical protein
MKSLSSLSLIFQNAHEELEGESLMIWPTGIYEDIPPEGIDIAFGPELKQKIDTALKDNCQDENQIEDCTKEIAAVIDNTDLATHSKRYVGLLRALLGIITAWSLAVTWMQHQHTNNKEPPTVIHFDPDKVSQISSLATATLVAIATGDDDIVAGTATVGLVPQPTGG